MTLTKVQAIDQITVTENGVILYREATKVFEDGKLLSKSYHRSSAFPGQSLDDVPNEVAAIANVVWTEDVINSYNESVQGSL